MSYHLTITEKANCQMIDIAAYIAEESGDYEAATRVIDELQKAMELLRDTPLLGCLPRAVSLKKAGHRFWICGNYLIFYRCNETTKTVIITAVVHTKQDYMRVVR